jgi:hypothetical protein
LLPYNVLAPNFRDGRGGPGELIRNDVRMDFELVHGPWPKSTRFSKAENLGRVGARRSTLNVATGGRIIFEHWGLLGGLICKGAVEFEGKGLALLAGTEAYLPKEGTKSVRPDGGWLFESDVKFEVWEVREKDQL